MDLVDDPPVWQSGVTSAKEVEATRNQYQPYNHKHLNLKRPVKRRRKVLKALVSFASLLLIGFLVGLAALNFLGNNTESAQPNPEGPKLQAVEANESLAATTSTTLTTQTSEPSQDENITVDPNAPDHSLDQELATRFDRWAIMKNGILYLRGRVPDEQVQQTIAQKAAAVVGPENIRVEYVIDPTAAESSAEGTPLLVEDAILFASNSSELDPAFHPLLNLGATLLAQNPAASITIVTHTDSNGSAADNLLLATQRATAIMNYWIEQGVSATQIRLDPRGEAEAQDTSDAELAKLQRRAEFKILGILD